MFQIGNDQHPVLVTLDIAEAYFCCDLHKCKGACCIEGDAGAPITEAEADAIAGAISDIDGELSPAGRRAIANQGISYTDCEGDLVTTLCDESEACALCHFAKDGLCLCAVEKARLEGKISVNKPISCSLYPLRVKEYGDFTALNYHKWDICHPAVKLGEKLGIRLYQFLKEPLIRRFGQEWYDELATTCDEYIRQYPNGMPKH